MAPASSSLLLPKHDVCFSFRGEDTRDTLVSHLYKDLRNKKIMPFMDDELFSDFEDFLQRIAGSKISIIIFSKSYADSKWCLRELVKIIECRKELNQIVMPVFYKVDPRDVRNQKGDFGTAFDRLLNFDRSKEEEWRRALKDAGNISGFDSSIFRSGAILVDTIVDNVSRKLSDGCSFNSSYDVFLSFRGDTRFDFISYLVKALRNRNILTFVDEELDRGDNISIGLNRANKGSKISVIIFSENYASSKWCLDELVKILECMNERNQIVIPVFYKVDPTDVRNQKGKFGTAFDILVKNHQSEEARWRSALKQAGSIYGILSWCYRLEDILIDEIVSKVDNKLKMLKIQSDKEVRSHHPDNVSTNPFGRIRTTSQPIRSVGSNSEVGSHHPHNISTNPFGRIPTTSNPY